MSKYSFEYTKQKVNIFKDKSRQIDHTLNLRCTCYFCNEWSLFKPRGIFISITSEGRIEVKRTLLTIKL